MIEPVKTFDEALARAEFTGEREGQRDVFEAFRAGKHVILHAPTGWGKTFAVLAALGHGHAIYSLPLRVLVNALVEDANAFKVRRCVAQHGARREHPLLDKGDDPANPVQCVFTTLDQSLSAFLGIPIGVSRRQGNIVPAVIDASHLIFDEFHLFDAARSWRTALFALLRSRQNGIILTATLSDPMLSFLFETLNATDHGAVLIQAKRPFKTTKYLQEGTGLDNPSNIKLGKRTIIIRNQIEWAKRTAQELRNQGYKVCLLHSELLPEDRAKTEEKVRKAFAKNAGGRPLILVATQVVEAGIDITCDVMHTDLCPPASFIQRAGRCARYADEVGTIYWHVPESVSPYTDAKAEIEALSTYLSECRELTPVAEQDIVNLVADKDIQAIEDFRKQHADIVNQCRVERDYSDYGDRIRQIESVNVALGVDPEGRYHVVSMSPSKFYGDGPYASIPVTPVQVDYDRKEKRRIARTTENIRTADFILFDPEYIGYRADYGFEVGAEGGEWAFVKEGGTERTKFGYPGKAESYRLHIERLQAQRPTCQWIVDRMALVLQEQRRLDPTLASQLATHLADLVVWAHDLGKLDHKWQAAHGVVEGRDRYPIAHSGEEDYPRLHRPPPHAWVSAWAIRDYLFDTFDRCFANPVFWTIMDHHGYSSDIRLESLHAYRLGFLDYLDDMARVEPWKGKDWGQSILTTQIHQHELESVSQWIHKHPLSEDDVHELYYMLSYILRRSDQLATALVSIESTNEENIPQSPDNIK